MLPSLVPLTSSVVARFSHRRVPTNGRPELPAKIWTQILETMTPEERYNIKGVNKLFFEASMNDKYRNLSLVSQDGFNFVETMEKLLYVP